MDEEEIDSWYEEGKEKIFQKYVKALEENNKKDLAEKKFNEEMTVLRKKHRKKYDGLEKKEKIKKKIKPIITIQKNIGNFLKKMKEIYK